MHLNGAQHHKFHGHLGSDEPVDALAMLFGHVQIGEVLGEDLALQWPPVAFFEDPLTGALQLEVALGGTDGLGVEVGSQRVADRGMVRRRLAVGVRQLASQATQLVGHPHPRGFAGQIGQRDTRGNHFVIVGVGLGVLADVAALQNHCAQAQGVPAACRPRRCWNRLPARRDPAAQTPLPPIRARLGGHGFRGCQLFGRRAGFRPRTPLR